MEGFGLAPGIVSFGPLFRPGGESPSSPGKVIGMYNIHVSLPLHTPCKATYACSCGSIDVQTLHDFRGTNVFTTGRP
jgi:hypothetical protein